MKGLLCLLFAMMLLGLSCQTGNMEQSTVDDESNVIEETEDRPRTSIVLTNLWENDLHLLKENPEQWSKLVDNEIRHILIPLQFLLENDKEHMETFLAKARTADIKCFVLWNGYQIKENSKRFLEELEQVSTSFNIEGILFEKIENISSSFWIRAATKVANRKDLLLLAHGQVHPSSLNTFFDGATNSKLYGLLNADLEKNKIKANEIRTSITNYNIEMPTSALAIYDTRSPFWGQWQQYPNDDLKTLLAFTLDGVVILNIESGGLGLSKMSSFYEVLLRLKKVNPALDYGVGMKWLDTENDFVLAFARKNGDATIMVLANCSNKAQKIRLEPKGLEGAYSNVFGQSTIQIHDQMTVELQPMEYILLSNRF